MSNTNQADIKICVNCKHHAQNNYFDHVCYRLSVKITDPVTGIPIFRNLKDCSKMREEFNACGPSGKLWEAA